MTRAELIALANQILEGDGSETEIDALMELFDQNIPHPDGSSLFFTPNTAAQAATPPAQKKW